MDIGVLPSNKMSFKETYCQGEIRFEKMYHDVTVEGVILEGTLNNEIDYLAASHADRRATFTGSGLPFHNEKQAFENTSNRGKVKLIGNAFKFDILFPNSFYVELGRKMIPPTVFIQYHTLDGVKRVVSIKLSDPIPYRMLEYPRHFTIPRNGATFYHAHHNLPVRTQEQVLLDSGYPMKNIMEYDFWGLKPAL